MKNSRLFEILYLLVEKRAVTAVELARRLEVSERTIYRDIDALSAAGIPVFTQQGQGGGIRLMDQFVLDKALLSQSQQDEILFALAGGRLHRLGQRRGGTGDLRSGEGGRLGPSASVLHLLQLRRGEKPPNCRACPAGI